MRSLCTTDVGGMGIFMNVWCAGFVVDLSICREHLCCAAAHLFPYVDLPEALEEVDESLVQPLPRHLPVPGGVSSSGKQEATTERGRTWRIQ